jgi:hypothetical protein
VVQLVERRKEGRDSGIEVLGIVMTVAVVAGQRDREQKSVHVALVSLYRQARTYQPIVMA